MKIVNDTSLQSLIRTIKKLFMSKGEADAIITLASYKIDSIEHEVISLEETPDFSSLPILCGQPMILFGNGTPQVSVVPNNWKQYDPFTDEGYNWNGKPSAVGQQYINLSASTNGRYIAVDNEDGTLIWKNF